MAEEPERRWLDPGVPTTRAEVVQVQSTREETSLLFGRLAPAGADAEPRARLERRIVLPPGIAKQLAAALAEAVRAVEQGVNPFLRTRQPAVAQAAHGHDPAADPSDPVAVFAALRQWKNEFR